MGLLLEVILPVLLILLPMTILVVIGKRKAGRVMFGLAVLGCSLLGVAVPILATYLAAQGLKYNFGPDEPKCVIGAGVFLFVGYLANILGLPIIGVAFFPPKQAV